MENINGEKDITLVFKEQLEILSMILNENSVALSKDLTDKIIMWEKLDLSKVPKESIMEEVNKIQTFITKYSNQYILSQLRNSINYLDEALNNENKIKDNLDDYIIICSIIIEKFDSLNNESINEDDARKIYAKIYKIMKLEISNGGFSLFDLIQNSEISKKYLDENVRHDIEVLTSKRFLCSKDLVNLNKALSLSLTNVDDKYRLVNKSILIKIVEVLSISDVKNRIDESMTLLIDKIKKNVHDIAMNDNDRVNAHNKIFENEKILSKFIKKHKIKITVACLSAMLSISSSAVTTSKLVFDDEKTIKNSFVDFILPLSALVSFSGFTLSDYNDRNKVKRIEQENAEFNETEKVLDIRVSRKSLATSEDINTCFELVNYYLETCYYTTYTEEDFRQALSTENGLENHRKYLREFMK